MNEKLTLDVLKAAVAGQAAAFRCVTEYQPAGGHGDKVFPPTYSAGNNISEYAVEDRIVDGQTVECVLLDSVQSQANRMELALLDELEAGQIKLPLVSVEFKGEGIKPLRVTSLDAPHRVADAIFRDSTLGGVIFRKSNKGCVLDMADTKHARELFGLCPTALIFGLWDSTGPRGGLGTKFQRAIVSEIIGYHAQNGVKTSSRIDPLQITLSAGTLYERAMKSDTTPDWTLNEEEAIKIGGHGKKIGGKKDKGGDGKPSSANHGNIPPTVDRKTGGYTISKALQTTVLSLVVLRRLRFPMNGNVVSDPKVDATAQTVLATLGLAAAVLARTSGADLRSRCQLFPTGPFVWELLDKPDNTPKHFEINNQDAIKLFEEALAEATQKGLPWEEAIELEPSAPLIELVKRNQELRVSEQGEE